MSVIGNFINRILGRNKIPQIESAVRDLNLEAGLNFDSLTFFENPNNFNEYCQTFFNDHKNYVSQYDYVNLISQMQSNGSMAEYQSYLQYVKENSALYYPSAAHGIDHTSRVLLFAEMLCMLDNISPHDRNLIMVAAQLHDIGREDDAKNFDHGIASVEKIERFGLLKDFDERDKNIIEFAIASHSLSRDQVEEQLKLLPRKDRKDYKRVLDYLQDADKLDRTRIANKGWGLDPNRLASDTAKKLVKVAHQNYFEYHNMMEYQRQREEREKIPSQLIEAFEIIRGKGFNISFEQFNNIVLEYQPGTVEMLMEQGKIGDIFSYDTFQKYRIPESFDGRLSQDWINPDELYNSANKNEQKSLLRSTFDADFMLYYELKKNNPSGFNMLCYIDVDKNTRSLAGLANEIRITDLEKLNANGNKFRLNDLFLLASDLSIEEYREIAQSGKFEDLYSSKYVKDEREIQYVREQLSGQNFYIDENTFHTNFKLIQRIVGDGSEILKNPEIRKYSFQEIYAAITKLSDSNARIIDGKYDRFDYDAKTIIDLIEYSKTTKLLDKVTEEEQLDIVETFATNEEFAKNPRFINYTLKKNKPYIAESPDEILNYVEYCSKMILADSKLSLEDAKSKILNALFDIDVPSKYRQKFENEIMETLYYHQKYIPDSQLRTSCGEAIDVINSIFNSKNIEDLRKTLSEKGRLLNSYNTSEIGTVMKKEISQYSKEDIVLKLQETEKQLELMPTMNVIATNGRTVAAKLLVGEPFNLAISTVMPKCSAFTGKIIAEHGSNAAKEIYKAMQNSGLNPMERCTSTINQDMIAHASSALQDEELVFAYVPKECGDISISSKNDMSTKKNALGKRITDMLTTSRNFDDLIQGTTEEHNETVMNNVYPRYIVCFDKITDIAIEKRNELEQKYKELGIDQPIEILFIDGKGTYIPRIKNQVQQEHDTIKSKLDTGTFSDKDFDEMFEKRESNFVLRTLQVIHSTSYRNDVWDNTYNFDILTSMTDILDKVSNIVSPEKARAVLDQVNILLERADERTEYGKRFYDHRYDGSMDTNRLNSIKKCLEEKVLPYERCETKITKETREPDSETLDFEEP